MGWTGKAIGWELLNFRSIEIILLTPLLCLPMIIVLQDSVSYCGYILIVMSVYWVFEVVPIPVTALMPLVLFPMFGIMTAGHTSQMYFKDTNALFLGGLMVAIAIEQWNLHKRIALAVLMVCGAKPRWLMLGFMCTTAFLSMWISNTATTAMMLPIAQAVLIRLSERMEEEENGNENEYSQEPPVVDSDGAVAYKVTDEETTPIPEKGNDITYSEKREFDDLEASVGVEGDGEASAGVEGDGEAAEKDEEMENQFEVASVYMGMSKGMMLCVAYSANIGGTASLIGTTPNLVLVGVLDDRYGTDHPINFLTWMIYSLPAATIFLFICWLWLLAVYLDLNPRNWWKDGKCACSCKCTCKKTEEEKIIGKVIKDEYKKLGPWTWAEITVLLHFTTLALLWVFRDIGGYGWGSLFREDYVTDSTPAIMMACILFCVPSACPSYFCCRPKEDTSDSGSKPSILNWPAIHKNLPWGLILLLGGGYALAEGCEVSGLSQWIGEQLTVLDYLETWVLVLVCTTVVCFFTEVTSNTAVATIFLPILAALADELCINPLYIMVPCTVVVTYAFMLPVATPPNAIAFSYGQLTIPDMASVGCMLNCLGIIWVNIWVNTYGFALFDLESYPEWADTDNNTCYEQSVNGSLFTTTMLPLTPLPATTTI